MNALHAKVKSIRMIHIPKIRMDGLGLHKNPVNIETEQRIVPIYYHR